MTQNSSVIPRNFPTKSRWLIFAAVVVVGMLIIWSLLTVNFEGIVTQSSTTFLNETVVAAPSYENWEPYSRIGASGVEVASDSQLYPVWQPYWQPYTALGVPGLENGAVTQSSTYFEWQPYAERWAPDNGK